MISGGTCEISMSSPPQDEPVHEHTTEQQIKRVVCIALDSSAYSEYAFEWAVDNYLKPATDLVVLLNCREPPTVPGPFGTAYVDFTDYLTVVEEQSRKESHSLLHYFAGLLKEKGFSVKAIALRGDPRDEIVRKVKEVAADALVLGSRGLGIVKRTLLGSLSDYCIHHVQCPVVVVKHPNPETLPQYGKFTATRMSPSALGH